MNERDPQPGSFQIVDLFDEMVAALISAQKGLDEEAIKQKEMAMALPQGTLQVPPLWFHLSRVALDLEVKRLAVDAQTLRCQLIDPITAGLMPSGTEFRNRISVLIEPITRLTDR